MLPLSLPSYIRKANSLPEGFLLTVVWNRKQAVRLQPMRPFQWTILPKR